MVDDVVIEDLIGKFVINFDGSGIKGKEVVGVFFDIYIVVNWLMVICEEMFLFSLLDEIVYILVLYSEFDGGFISEVCGVFIYWVNKVGLIINMCGYWNFDMMIFGNQE